MSEAFERGFSEGARQAQPLNEDDFIEVVGLLVGKLKRELVDRIDAVAKERHDTATEIAALKTEIERLRQTSGGRTE